MNFVPEEEKIKKYYKKYWTNFKNIHLKERHFSTDIQQHYFAESHSDFLAGIFLKAPGRLVLNLGCGKGTHSLPLEKRGFRVVNVDYLDEALTLTKEFYSKEEKNAMVVRGDIKNLPFKPGSFDIVMNFGVMEHFKDARAAYNQMAEVLKSKGILHSEVITKRLSVHTLERLVAVLFSFSYNLIFIRIGKLLRLIKSDYKNEDFYENSYPQAYYLNTLRDSGISKLCCIGIRPYPFLRLPQALDNLYAQVLKPVNYFLKQNQVRFSRNKLFQKWCAIWLFYGIKE